MSGFMRLFFVIFCATHARLVLENISKYGLLARRAEAERRGREEMSRARWGTVEASEATHMETL